ncbi:MAG: hypothetical protein IPO06_25630 [Leptospiraceae bacterium]|nr:hypothetical protein [Leptospiraceae bacterium]
MKWYSKVSSSLQSDSLHIPCVRTYPSPTNIPEKVQRKRYLVACDLFGIKNKNRELAKIKRNFLA